MALSQAEESRGLMSILEPVDIEAVGGKHCCCLYHQWCGGTYFLPSHHNLRPVKIERCGGGGGGYHGIPHIKTGDRG